MMRGGPLRPASRTPESPIGCRLSVTGRGASQMKAISVGVRVIAVVVLLFAADPSRAHAQSAANSGQITGQVVDPSQAAIPNVPVVVRNVDTNYERTTVTDGA